MKTQKYAMIKIFVRVHFYAENGLEFSLEFFIIFPFSSHLILTFQIDFFFNFRYLTKSTAFFGVGCEGECESELDG